MRLHDIFDERQATIAELCDALDVDYAGYTPLRRKLLAAPKYGNDDERADAVGREMIDAFTRTVARHAAMAIRTADTTSSTWLPFSLHQDLSASICSCS